MTQNGKETVKFSAPMTARLSGLRVAAVFRLPAAFLLSVPQSLANGSPISIALRSRLGWTSPTLGDCFNLRVMSPGCSLVIGARDRMAATFWRLIASG